MRLFPRSLAGQLALLIALALLVAQAVNFAFLLNEGQRARLARTESPALFRLARAAEAFAEAAPGEGRPLLRRRSGRGARFTATARPVIERRALIRDPALEARVRDALRDAGVAFLEVQAAEAVPRRRAWMTGGEDAGRARLLFVSVRLADGEWLNARLAVRPRDCRFLTRLLLATLALYVIVLGATLLAARRLARPLGRVTMAAERFGGREPGAPLPVEGPDDLRRLAEAFNAMRARVADLLTEKDRMIGAIGHDLRTPLAALRIGAENMPDEAERERMAATVGHLDQTLDDILALARAGRPSEAARPVDLGALVEAVAEDIRATGGSVAFEAVGRVVVTARPNSIRRAAGNLIENAVRYAGSARVRVSRENGEARVLVEDDGPGIPPEALELVTRPFQRVESSRNRATGGSGLGLAIARAVAEGEGGRLELANRAGGGLAAAIVLPA